ncbi:sigma-54-dependent transcriptional regulator [Pontiella sulfatireligans]|uniref:Transcriptional regulatory protein ZraR n=1 Tax=Pontiella sulfatireligans TaxID=2750658 RepID=A0A6C2URW6_9BACT|nr:sigma-54 dependent transcriptional regulator [Pontiella sulfatireligans]VGO22879.1 Transcriptional regulatory protein ZraR [Pontiella sulfatireligans]
MNKKPTILIVDDEKSARDGLVRALRRDYNVFAAENGNSALEVLANQKIDVLLSDVRMPGMDGITLMQRALVNNPELVCIILTAYGDVDLAVEAMKHGATDFMTKPINLDKLELVLGRVLKAKKIELENEQLKVQLDSKYGLENIIGCSAPMQEVFDTIRQVASSRATVLIQGESGTGKELVAKAIHQLGSRSKGAFVAVHCAALSQNLLESELFGHEKGAFTGAMERRIGRFEKADGGSLFLDEISEIDASVQVKILRALEERQVERVGGDTPVDVDARLIAATNRDLKAMVDEGDFREDLFYRLYVVVITLPPLRDRQDDILLLLSHYLAVFNEENGKRFEGFTPAAYEMLSAYKWPGNIRELRNLVERMVVLARGSVLDVKDIPVQVREQASGGGEVNINADLTVDEMEKRMVIQALEKTGGNRTKAAERLGISRRTLHRKLNQYGIQ